MRSGLVALSLAMACGTPTPSTTEPTILPPPDTDSGTTTTTEETEPDGGFIDAALMVVVARFAYDDVLDKAVEYANPGEGFSPLSVEVVLFDSDAIYVGSNETNTCSVVVEFAGPQSEAAWVEEQAAWFGFDVPSSATIVDHCDGFGLPQEFQGDAGGQVSKWKWGAAVGELSDLMKDTLAQSLPDSEWAALQSYALGGLLKSNLFIAAGEKTEFSDFGYGVAFTVDGNFEIDVSGAGNTIPILATEVEVDDGITRAYYEVTFGFYNGLALTNPPPQEL